IPPRILTTIVIQCDIGWSKYYSERNSYKMNLTGFVPLGRCFHESVLIGTQLYFLGGINSDEIFYLDVSLPFDSKKLLWTDLTTNSAIPINSAFATSCVGGQNNNFIFLFEHHKKDNDELNNLITYTFDIKSQEWDIPTIINPTQIPPVIQGINAACNPNGTMYIFGGYNPKLKKSYNDMYILDSLNLSWKQYLASLSIIKPIIRSDYTATLLPNSIIISLFDTNIGTWTVMTAENNDVIIQARRFHTAVLISDGLIVIYGGASNNNSKVPSPSLAVLDTKPETYKWYSKQNIGKNIPPPLAYHTATLVGDYMIITFGAKFSGEKFDNENNLNTKVYILDTKSFLWVSSTSQNGSSTTSIIPSNSATSSLTNSASSSITPLNPTNSNNPTSTINPNKIKIFAGLTSTAGVTILVV
ncbi:3109_t:CDS:2, partial [Scutellospora calospora]